MEVNKTLKYIVESLIYLLLYASICILIIFNNKQIETLAMFADHATAKRLSTVNIFNAFTNTLIKHFISDDNQQSKEKIAITDHSLIFQIVNRLEQIVHYHHLSMNRFDCLYSTTSKKCRHLVHCQSEQHCRTLNDPVRAGLSTCVSLVDGRNDVSVPHHRLYLRKSSIFQQISLNYKRFQLFTYSPSTPA